MAPTSGFTLSALPRSPTVPAGIGKIGEIDAKEIYDAVRAGLNTVEAAGQAPNRALLVNEQARMALVEGDARRAVLPTLTNATLTDTPNRSRILAAQADAAAIDTPVHSRGLLAQTRTTEEALQEKQLAHQREAGLRANAAGEMPAFLKELEAAKQLDDYDAAAAALGNLRVKYPWVSLPEYKDSIGKSLDEEHQAALKASQSQADRESRETVADINRQRSEATARARAQATMRAAELKSPQEMARRLSELRVGIDDGTATEAQAYEAQELQRLLYNQQSTAPKDPNAAKVSPPAGLVLLTNQQNAEAVATQAQRLLTAALESGDPDTIAEAQAAYNEASAKAQNAKREWELYHAERTKKVSKTVDPDTIDRLTRNLTGGKAAAPQTLPGRPLPAGVNPADVAPDRKPAAIGKPLTKEQALTYLQAAGGDRAKAEAAARKDGWSF